MNHRTIAIAAVLMAAVLTGISITALFAYADESETRTDQEIKQKNVGSGSSNNNNCAENSIESFAIGEEDCRFNNNSPPVDLTATETATD
jgi:ABC-type phosphate transport system substrate-binding protein